MSDLGQAKTHVATRFNWYEQVTGLKLQTKLVTITILLIKKYIHPRKKQTFSFSQSGSKYEVSSVPKFFSYYMEHNPGLDRLKDRKHFQGFQRYSMGQIWGNEMKTDAQNILNSYHFPTGIYTLSVSPNWVPYTHFICWEEEQIQVGF